MQPDTEVTTAAEAEAARAERRNFLLMTTLSGIEAGKLEAKVRNLSSGGMMIELVTELEDDLVRGQRVTAELRNIGRVKGEIAWVRGRRVGVRFDREIDPELARKPITVGEGTPDYVKPVLVPGRALKYVDTLKGW